MTLHILIKQSNRGIQSDPGHLHGLKTSVSWPAGNTCTLSSSPCVCVCVASLQGYRRPNYKELATDQARYQRWLLKHECKAFYTPVFAEDLKQGTQYLLQVGPLQRKECSTLEATPRPYAPPPPPPSSSCGECNVTLVLRLRDWAASSPTPWCWASKTTGGTAT